MKNIIPTIILILSLVATSFAVPLPIPEYGVVPERQASPRQDQYRLAYYNMCSGWTFHWPGYCWGGFDNVPLPPMYGTCFDLADCPSDCRHLTDVWWATYCQGRWGTVDVEIYCADEYSCPVGPALAGVYDHWIGTSVWYHFFFEDLDLCPCDLTAGKFVVMITDRRHVLGTAWPWSDANSKNIEAGCETEWRCAGHSFVYQNLTSYCEVYGVPGALWVDWPTGGCTNYPPVPPGWFEDMGPGFYCEWLIECYISCQGATATEEASWSEIKALYK